MAKEKMDKGDVAQAIVDTICAANDYTPDSGLATHVVRRLASNLPASGLEELQTLVVLGNRWVKQPAPASEQHIKNALVLLEDIGRQACDMSKLYRMYVPKLDGLNVRLYVAGMIVLETNLGQAIQWLAGDVYCDENSNWSEADSAEVYVF